MVERKGVGRTQPFGSVARKWGGSRCECGVVYACAHAFDGVALRACACLEIFKARPERVAQKRRSWRDGRRGPPLLAGGFGDRPVTGSTRRRRVDGQELSTLAIG